MEKFFRTVAVVVGATLLAFILVPSASISAVPQQRGAGQAATTPAADKPLPRTSWDGKPDMTGVWGGPVPGREVKLPPRPATEGGAALAELARLYQPRASEKSKALSYLDDPRLHCGPYGFPRYIGIPGLQLSAVARPAFYFLLQIIQAPKHTIVLVEYTYSGFRIIPTDGTPHPKTIAPSYFGDSVGRWEEDTLVVDVKGFNGKIWLQSPQNFATAGGGGWLTSDALHEVERYRLVDADTLEYQATVEDPKVLTGAWTTPKYLIGRAAPGAMLHEALCLEPEDLAVMTAAAKAAQEQKK
jgi:hypothetical protein